MTYRYKSSDREVSTENLGWDDRLEPVALVGVEGWLAVLAFWTFPFDATYTEQKSGADLDTVVGTSTFLNALGNQDINSTIRWGERKGSFRSDLLNKPQRVPLAYRQSIDLLPRSQVSAQFMIQSTRSSKNEEAFTQ